MKTFQTLLKVTTPKRGTYSITDKIEQCVKESGIQTGLCHVFCQHTSASLIITENADPTVREDIEYWMQKMILDGDPAYRHNYEGDDDMSGHIRSMITQSSQTIPVSSNRLNLGTWQGLFLYEHRTGRFERHLVVTVQGE
ncbi:secondary thiamine-phosphate synthase enzyme YjbQ [Hydrogenovibrio sp. JE_KL2]|uniref:secondary thiamine-phosphate synthase enzyme YjbQ n=1 Tax=Hydrogenovibrio sp. JE_KL2 TaxID=2651188 RepID=UPI00128D4088|nr:secondary thiamine-phosphate synthase enzyme YjbQ [Hydrogenovibrio sp. JE_KL2]MPQ76580.1 YjbQ family protein [Hydrogenovibrio sp. JE_KL2]